MKLRGRGRSIEDIVQEECRKRKVSEQELRMGTRRPFVSKVGAATAYRIKEELETSGTEVARNLRANTSSINLV